MKSYNASGEGGALQGSERRSASFSAERPPSSSSPTTNGCTSAWPLVIQDCATSPASSPRRNLSHTLVSIRTVNAGSRCRAPPWDWPQIGLRAECLPQPAATVGVDQFLQAKFHHGGLGLARMDRHRLADQRVVKVHRGLHVNRKVTDLLYLCHHHTENGLAFGEIFAHVRERFCTLCAGLDLAGAARFRAGRRRGGASATVLRRTSPPAAGSI